MTTRREVAERELARVVGAVCAAHGLSPRLLSTPAARQARAEVCVLGAMGALASWTQIGQAIGRDRTTAMRIARAYRRRLEVDPVELDRLARTCALPVDSSSLLLAA